MRRNLLLTGLFVLAISWAVGILPAASQTDFDVPPEPITIQDLKPDDYPRDSLRRNEQGLVGVQYVVDEKGNVAKCVVDASSGHARLDQAACAVVNRWKFKPATREGKPVSALMIDSIGFRATGIFSPGDIEDDVPYLADPGPVTPDPEPGAWDPSFNVRDLAPGPGDSTNDASQGGAFKRR